jgi:transposase-like protein
MEEAELRPEICLCPHCQEGERIGVHQREERMLICQACQKTFAWSHGTPFAGAKFPLWGSCWY